MTQIGTSPTTRKGETLRVIWPQWQGAGSDVVAALAPEFPLDVARRGYSVGTRVLEAVLPSHEGPTAHVPVSFGDEGLETERGVEARSVVARQLELALGIIRQHSPDRILTLGGECSVSVASFTSLAHMYGDDLAVVWIDSHPDVGTPESEYHGYHAMAVATITGHGDAALQALLPATVPASRVAIVGLHSWTEDDYPNAAAWGVSTFSPGDLRQSSNPLQTWLRQTGCRRVAIHLDVDVIDSDELVLGLGAEPGGHSSAEVSRIVRDVSSVADVVGFTVAEYLPRQVIHLTRLLAGMPLL